MELPDRIRHVHDEAVDAMVKMGPWELYCRACFKTEEAAVEEMATYFESGWPQCCYRTMELRRKKEADRGDV